MEDREKFFGNPYLLQIIELALIETDKMSLNQSFVSTSHGNLMLAGKDGVQILDVSGGLNSARTKLGRSNLEQSMGMRINQLNITIREVVNDMRVQDVKYLNASTVLIHELQSNDLVLYNYGLGGLHEKKRLKGAFEGRQDLDECETSFQGSCNEYWYLWKSGRSDLKIVNLKTFEI